eukprot:jgi/Botrbrau1/1694/Bobra.116_2s0036.1
MPLRLWKPKSHVPPALQLEVQGAAGSHVSQIATQRLLPPGCYCFSYSELLAATNNFSDACVLGEGGFGRVYRGTLPGGAPVAIKKLDRSGLQGDKEFNVEVAMLGRLRHPNIVRLLGACTDQGQRAAVFEFLACGSLRACLDSPTQPMAWLSRLSIALDVAQGLAHLHEGAEPPLIHRDLTSNNILVGTDGRAKIADFGLARTLHLPKDSPAQPSSNVVTGTFGYVAPEALTQGPVTDAVDSYSFGVVLLELMTGQPAVANGQCLADRLRPLLDDVGALQAELDPTLRGGPPIPATQLAALAELACACLQKNPSRRPRAAVAVEMLEAILAFQESPRASLVPYPTISPAPLPPTSGAPATQPLSLIDELPLGSLALASPAPNPPANASAAPGLGLSSQWPSQSNAWGHPPFAGLWGLPPKTFSPNQTGSAAGPSAGPITQGLSPAGQALGGGVPTQLPTQLPTHRPVLQGYHTAPPTVPGSHSAQSATGTGPVGPFGMGSCGNPAAAGSPFSASPGGQAPSQGSGFSGSAGPAYPANPFFPSDNLSGHTQAAAGKHPLPAGSPDVHGRPTQDSGALPSHAPSVPADFGRVHAGAAVGVQPGGHSGSVGFGQSSAGGTPGGHLGIPSAQGGLGQTSAGGLGGGRLGQVGSGSELVLMPSHLAQIGLSPGQAEDMETPLGAGLRFGAWCDAATVSPLLASAAVGRANSQGQAHEAMASPFGLWTPVQPFDAWAPANLPLLKEWQLPGAPSAPPLPSASPPSSGAPPPPCPALHLPSFGPVPSPTGPRVSCSPRPVHDNRHVSDSAASMGARPPGFRTCGTVSGNPFADDDPGTQGLSRGSPGVPPHSYGGLPWLTTPGCSLSGHCMAPTQGLVGPARPARAPPGDWPGVPSSCSQQGPACSWNVTGSCGTASGSAQGIESAGAGYPASDRFLPVSQNGPLGSQAPSGAPPRSAFSPLRCSAAGQAPLCPGVCLKCLDAPRAWEAKPCGHLIACQACALALEAANDPCPVCHARIKGLLCHSDLAQRAPALF